MLLVLLVTMVLGSSQAKESVKIEVQPRLKTCLRALGTVYAESVTQRSIKRSRPEKLQTPRPKFVASVHVAVSLKRQSTSARIKASQED